MIRRGAFRVALVLGVLFVLLTAGLAGLLATLNSAPGRGWATAEVNRLAGPRVHITGLAGHFPDDLKLASLTLSDTQGVWLSAADVELRWHALALLQHEADVTRLSAAALTVTRQPVPAASRGNGGISLAHWRLKLAALDIARLQLGAALAGEPVTLAVTGAASIRDERDGSLTLDATTPDGAASYRIVGGANAKTIGLNARIAEPPDGLLGHFAGPDIHAPLTADIALAGPRDDAKLKFLVALGAGELTGTGRLGLLADAPHADIRMTVPALAPFGALAGQAIGGDTALHVIIDPPQNGLARVQLSGRLGLTAGPQKLTAMLGKNAKFLAIATLRENQAAIQNLNIQAAGFGLAAQGSLTPQYFRLTTALDLKNLALLSPRLTGAVQETGSASGSFKNFALHAGFTGIASSPGLKSGPFAITLDAKNLPSAPQGSISGTGALENAPLTLAANFAVTPGGAATLQVTEAKWRGVHLTADLTRQQGAMLPTGSAEFNTGNLAELAPLLPWPVSGSASGQFAYPGGGAFKLDLRAQNLVVARAVGAINATLHAAGPPQALAVTLTGNVAALRGAPARVSLAGTLNLDDRSANVQNLAASWHGLDGALLKPAAISTQPGLAIRHAALRLNGGEIDIDGVFTPRLAAKISVTNLPASLLANFVPADKAAGTLSATAKLTGSVSAPLGALGFNAEGIKMLSGPGASAPALDLNGTASLAAASASIKASLRGGKKLELNAAGSLPLAANGALNLHLTGQADLRLANPLLAITGVAVSGIASTNLALTGTPSAPNAAGTLKLANGAVQDIGAGLNLSAIDGTLTADGDNLDLTNLSATAGAGQLAAHGTLGLRAPMPVHLTLTAHNAAPITSDIVTETLDGDLTLTGALRGAMALGGNIRIDQANINIPASLPPEVANLPILNELPPAAAPPPPPPPVRLDLLITAGDRIFVRGDGLFAEFGGHVRLGGTAASPQPEGGFDLIRGAFSLAGTALQFTSGTISFNGDGFSPALDLVATATASDNNSTDTLTIGGTASHPRITLSSTPPLPSDEILAELLFGQSTASLSPFQAASLAAALAQLSGVGGGFNPLDKLRNALGLDELSLSGSGSGAPSLQAGRYVAPGVYVGAAQATSGQGTQASVQINLTKGLKLNTTTGTSSTGTGSSVGLTYQFNY